MIAYMKMIFCKVLTINKKFNMRVFKYIFPVIITFVLFMRLLIHISLGNCLFRSTFSEVQELSFSGQKIIADKPK